MADVVHCCHCRQAILPAPSWAKHGFRHHTSDRVACYPGQYDFMAESEYVQAGLTFAEPDDRTRDLFVQLLTENKRTVHPGRGKQNAKLVRLCCEVLGLNEDLFLPEYVVRDKQKWGL